MAGSGLTFPIRPRGAGCTVSAHVGPEAGAAIRVESGAGRQDGPAAARGAATGDDVCLCGFAALGASVSPGARRMYRWPPGGRPAVARTLEAFPVVRRFLEGPAV